eukprot:4231749-Pleurochrysis_carterae.AAC.1
MEELGKVEREDEYSQAEQCRGEGEDHAIRRSVLQRGLYLPVPLRVVVAVGGLHWAGGFVERDDELPRRHRA